ncbi:MAG TPA: metal-dependent transcriptional regulator [Methanoregula sp.]|nr:metal-dependent transcriptional regulator [Methanoregula sp.]
MQSSLREDYLEAIQVFRKKNGRAPTGSEIAILLGKDPSAVHTELGTIAASGDITITGDGAINLTPKGAGVADGIVKKHETLQCFLSEMLGMEASRASTEACTLEHTISDETIDRLEDLLRRPKPPGRRGPGISSAGICAGADIPCSEPCSPFSLLDFDEGDALVVRCILGQSCAKRLLDLGVVPGQQVRIQRKLRNRSIVLLVKGCAVALSPEIAAAVSVERCP